MPVTKVSKENTAESVLDLFGKMVVQTPEAIAVICADQRLTYSELDRRANQLAWHLHKLSVKTETLVGICVGRSLEMVIGILGILKAGGAYVPIDPSYPLERVSFILADAHVTVLITESKFSASFLDQSVQLVYLDTETRDIAENPSEAPAKNILYENLAYVIYTSGSTGKPKGVMITHSNLLHFVRIAGIALDVMSDDVVLHTASIAYALSVRQLMVPLVHGATVVIAMAEEMQDPLSMFQLIKYRNVTLMDVVPSFWRTCVQRILNLSSDELEPLMVNSLRRIVSIGEPLLSDLPQRWAAQFGRKTKLVNIFGQTETTGVVATYQIPPETNIQNGIVPIGRSIPDTRLYLLDANLNPVPQGEQGELCVSNPCLARGYLNRPELTSEKFVPNPFGDGFSTRLYRTGDLARMREDGNIEFLGRGDHQVKIRGQRLELGEVEMLLREHASVSNCVVTVCSNQPDEKYLVAYLVQAVKHPINIDELRYFLRNKAPAYMVPSTFVILDSIPLTPNGKIDRLALPDPSTAMPNVLTSQRDLVEPRNHTEQVVANIWKELLKIKDVGIYDNFFDLGGDSLNVVRLFLRMEQEFGTRLPFSTILQAPTIALLAEYMEHNPVVIENQILVPIQYAGHCPPFYLVHGVGGTVLGYRDLVNELGRDRPIYGLQAIGYGNYYTYDSSIESMASHYIEAIRSHQPSGPYQIGGYCFGGVVAYEMACQLEKLGEQVSLLAIFEGYLPDSKNHRVSRRQRFYAILRSIPHWMKDYTSMSPEDLLFRTRSTLFKLWAKISRHPGLQSQARVQGILQTELTWVPEQNIELTKLHSAALRQYRPGRYAGKVTLFRARYRSFNEIAFGSLDQTMGWGDVALGGVEVKTVDGFHRNIHLPPYVPSLASELNCCLEMINESEKRYEL